jgi:hypothetical protein
MDFYYNTFLRFILDDDSPFSTFRAYICSCSVKGQGYGWLLGHLFVRFAHFIFGCSVVFSFWFALAFDN